MDLELSPIQDATRSSRAVAAFIDLMILFIVTLSVVGLFEPMWRMMMDPELKWLNRMMGFGTWSLLHIYLLATKGQTIGKHLCDIKVVRADGEKASLGALFWRHGVVALVVGIPLIGHWLVIIDMLSIFHENQRMLHDHAAGTRVVVA
ncbi:RDD family protein [Acanthopleuribacter pedis]|uniref:RDD family protein n=1 Tax=Acanthopleuribacter pedis TaxID=442870 RepID=A0A8J7QEH9_9BACT|nr:RDD family protein [Acanthopleuribacter pedis]MBO1319361.1 RDD family protein [Acanthopleuribacter pedis]